MSRFIALVKVNFLALLKQFSSSKKKVSGAGAIVVMALICIYMSGIYSWLFAMSLKPAGLLHFLPMLMSVFACIMSLMLTVFAASGIVFGGKDNDFVLALPISAFQILLCRIMALYLQNLLIVLFMMVPCSVVYAISGGTGGVFAIMLMLVGSVFLAFIPTLIGVVLGYIISWFSGRVEKKTLISTILNLVFVVVIMAASFQINALLSTIVANPDGMSMAFSSYLLPFGLFGKASTGSFSSLLLLMIISTIPFLIVVWLFSKNYKKILTNMNSHTARSDFKIAKVESTSQFQALLKKEITRFFGTPMYFINSGIGAILLVGACIFSLFKIDTLRAFLIQAGGMNPLPFVLALFAFTIAMVNTTCVSISLEGDRLWILKEAPINVKNIFNAKIALNLIVILPAAVLSTLLLAIAVQLNILQIAILLLFSVSLGALVAYFGLVVNLKYPKLDAENEVIVLKQSTSSMIGVIGGMIVAFSGMALYAFVLSRIMSIEVFAIVVSLLFAGVSLLLAKYLQTKGQKIFEAL